MGNQSILWIGTRERAEFSEIADSVDRLSRATFVKSAASALQIGSAAAGSSPDLIILAQSRPGELFRIDELSQRWPNARLCFLLASWCNGMKRLPHLLDELPAYYTHEWKGTLTESLLSVVGSREETRAGGSTTPPHSAPALPSGIGQGKLAAVYGRTPGDRQAVADALKICGYQAAELTWHASAIVHGADLVVWEADVSPAQRQDEIAILQRRHPGARILALVTFPRDAELRRLAEQGVQVVGRPFSLAALSEFSEISATSPASAAA